MLERGSDATVKRLRETVSSWESVTAAVGEPFQSHLRIGDREHDFLGNGQHVLGLGDGYLITGDCLVGHAGGQPDAYLQQRHGNGQHQHGTDDDRPPERPVGYVGDFFGAEVGSRPDRIMLFRREPESLDQGAGVGPIVVDHPHVGEAWQPVETDPLDGFDRGGSLPERLRRGHSGERWFERCVFVQAQHFQH